jgi:hypothetical protein
MHWKNRTETPIEKGQIITPSTIEDPKNDSVLMVTNKRDLDFDSFMSIVTQYQPFSVAPPFDIGNTGWTSRAAARAFDNVPDPIHIGVVVAGTSDWEREDFIFWAQHQGYAPIILLPDARKTRMHQLASLVHNRILYPSTWLHLAGHYDGVDLGIVDAIVTVGPALWE